MKYKKVLTTLVLALALVGAFTVISSAANGLQEISAYLNSNITVKMDGEPQTFLDANGARVYPISYKGTTYLPIRAVAGLVGLDVDWDQATQTVLLGEQRDGVDLIDTYKAYYLGNYTGQVQTADGKTEDISGISCNHWLEFNADMAERTRSISFNLQGKHDTLTFSYYSQYDATLTVLGDNDTVLGEFPITGAAVAKTVTLPLFQTNELKFQMVLKGPGRIFDAYLDAEQ